MKLEVLGSGGAVTTPKPFCQCTVCVTARHGSPVDSRFGPSVFIHGPDLLIDTPEEISVQLNRSTIQTIKACTYSHWHPDHTSGKRIFEMNRDWIGFPPNDKSTRVYLTEKVVETFGQFLGIKGHFDFLSYSNLISLKIIGNSEEFYLNDFRIKPVQLGQDYSFGFEIFGFGNRILIIMDELKFWQPGDHILNTRYDLIYMPLGIVDVNPITHKRNIDENHPVLKDEQTISETLEYMNRLLSGRFLLSHIEEPDEISYQMGIELGNYCTRITGKKVEIAYDTQVVEI
jgi:phosphoribosyl 1,2-cyclic phosphate phosphodiesterase